MDIIGVVKLAPGRVGLYDDLTRLHLTQSNPVAEVKANMNTANLKRGVKYGSLLLLSGTLCVDEHNSKKEEAVKPVVEEKKEKPVEKKIEVKEVVEEKKEEPKKEEVKEEVKVAPKKTTSKKTTKKEVEDKKDE